MDMCFFRAFIDSDKKNTKVANVRCPAAPFRFRVCPAADRKIFKKSIRFALFSENAPLFTVYLLLPFPEYGIV